MIKLPMDTETVEKVSQNMAEQAQFATFQGHVPLRLKENMVFIHGMLVIKAQSDQTEVLSNS